MICEIIVMAGGFISFPIFTRLLTKEEYGIMNLIGIALSLVEAFLSMGLRHSSQRFFSTYKKTGQIENFFSTTIISSLVFGFLGTFGIILTLKFLNFFNILSDTIQNLFIIASFLVVIRIMTKIIGCFYRIRERPKVYSIFSILSKYIAMGLAIILVFFYSYGLMGYFFGLVLGELLALFFWWIFMVRECGGFTSTNFSYPILKEMIDYGLPLVIAGFATTILSMGDRYVIGYFMTVSDVAMYSVPYNLCNYLTGILVTGFEFAFIPLIVNEWEMSEKEKTHQKIQTIVRLYCMVALPIIFGVCALGEQFIIIMASDKYSETAYILPYVITGVMLQGLFAPFMIGLFLYKKTKALVKLTWYAATLNVLMNLILVPTMGLLGAAISTLFSYVLLFFLGTIASSKYLKVKVPWYKIFLYGGCSLLMYFSLRGIDIIPFELRLFVKVLMGFIVYSSLLFLFDTDLRRSIVLHVKDLCTVK